ncbi:MotA/TolQ/ExbB proton channel family protein [Sulfitobacter sp. CS16]|uniref:MotA/TolQ/ExbB proton channel family protein n=1 Tax=Sulfitobacter sp. CS16 TaxID=3368573 RepID=UPI003745C5A3
MLAREEVTRLAAHELAGLCSGLRPLELIVTIAPLIGLLGTVLGMIEVAVRTFIACLAERSSIGRRHDPLHIQRKCGWVSRSDRCRRLDHPLGRGDGSKPDYSC